MLVNRVRSTPDEFVSRAYKREFIDLPYKIKEIKAYDYFIKGCFQVYYSFDYNGVEIATGMVTFNEGPLTKKIVQEHMLLQVGAYEKLYNKTKNAHLNDNLEDEKYYYLNNYAWHKCAIELDRINTTQSSNMPQELDERIWELSKGPIEDFEKAAEELSKEYYKIYNAKA